MIFRTNIYLQKETLVKIIQSEKSCQTILRNLKQRIKELKNNENTYNSEIINEIQNQIEEMESLEIEMIDVLTRFDDSVNHTLKNVDLIIDELNNDITKFFD